MRVRALVFVAIGLCCAAVIGILRADPEKDKRIAALIRQLGSPDFALREAAQKELEEIGEPALEPLRKATSDRDPEIRRRADKTVHLLSDRLRAVIARKELARWQGEWFGELQQSLTIKDDRWTSGTPTFGPISGVLRGIEIKGEHTQVDMVVDAGPTKGSTCRAIFKLDGRTLHYCGAYGPRPTEFKSSSGNTYIAWKRDKPAPPPPVIVEETFESAVLPIELMLPESKLGIRKITARARLTEGGNITLRLDPNSAQLDAFGDPRPAANPQPILTLDCTLKLIKSEKNRQLYEIRGPKLTSKLSFVAFKDLTPWGDGRLLVHDKTGAVKHALELHIPRQHMEPCHPGCFPAGTTVCVPGGVRAIESIRKGDSVTTITADGTSLEAKVTDIFATRNRVLSLRVDGATLITTETQPIALVSGGFRPAGELKPGDRIWRWTGSARAAVVVGESTAAIRETAVFNLVLGEPTVFIAGDFLVRSKPPAVKP